MHVLYYSNMVRASIDEVFCSIQGEGLHIGRRHVFVRFQGCDINCRYCDTPAARRRSGHCRVQSRDNPLEYHEFTNPVSGESLLEMCRALAASGPGRPWLSLTGGEPLLQTDFLLSWLHEAKRHFHIYLETSGVHHQNMRSIRGLVDAVGMDFKLPSATGLRQFWAEHREFLSACEGMEVFVKAVVTMDTSIEDILTSSRIIADIGLNTPLIIQPATGQLAPKGAMLLYLQAAALEVIPEVRVIPQAHKMLGVA